MDITMKQQDTSESPLNAGHGSEANPHFHLFNLVSERMEKRDDNIQQNPLTDSNMDMLLTR